MKPIQIASLILGSISLILGILTAIETTRDILAERRFWKSYRGKSQEEHEIEDLNARLVAAGLHHLTEEECEQIQAGKCLSEMERS